MPLELVRREGDWLVFDPEAFRREVVQYFWGGAFEPNAEELFARGARPGDLELPNTHWRLARNIPGFVRSDLYGRMRPEARRRLDSLPAAPTAIERPRWVSERAWRRFQAAPDGVHRYPGESSILTAAILIKRDGVLWAGYAEASTDEDYLRRQMGVIEPGFWRRVTLGDTTENARVRWLANANRGFNNFMWRQVQAGVGPGQALRNYREAVHQAYLRAFIPLIGGSFAAHPAGGTIGDIARSF